MKFKGSKTKIREILTRYRVELKDFQPIKDGIINSSFFITTKDDKKYVLRVYKQGNRTEGEIQNEINMTNQFRKAGVPIPKLKKNINGKELDFFYDTKGKKSNVVLMEFVKGKHLLQEDHELISECAEYQSLMHVTAKKYLKKVNTETHFIKMIDWLISEKNNAIKKLDKNLANKYENLVKEILVQTKEHNRDIALLTATDVHLDYDSNNIIVADKHIRGIIDFDDMSKQPMVLDVAFSLWWWLFFNKTNEYEKILKLYKKGYEKHRKFTNSESMFLSLFIRMRNATLAGLLFVNLNPKKPNIKSFKKALKLDRLFCEIKI